MKKIFVLPFILASFLTSMAVAQIAPSKRRAVTRPLQNQQQQVVNPKTRPMPTRPTRPVAPTRTMPLPPAMPVIQPPAPMPEASASESSSDFPVIRESYWEPGFRFTLSQEMVTAYRPPNMQEMITQSQGTTLSLKYKKPSGSGRFLWTTALEFGIGTIRFKGKENDPIPDQVINPWYMFSINPGFAIRTSPPSDFGISFPVGYRIVKWPIDDPTFTVSRAAGIGYGVQFTYAAHFTANSTLIVSFTNQMAWQATQWAVGYDYAFR